MEIIKDLISYREIYSEWLRSKMGPESARMLTLKQVYAFEKIIKDDKSWNYLLSFFEKGRKMDSWLALDWPDGFDELLLCVPLCSLVEFECSKCTIGKRQENHSCANENSVFGFIAELLKDKDRDGLKEHIEYIKELLIDINCKWDMKSHKLISLIS